MIFDTDVLMWFLRGNGAAAALIGREADRALSIVSVMELYQGARSNEEIIEIRRFLVDNGFRVIPLNEAMSHLAATLVEEHALKDGLKVADALIASTARQTAAVLATGNIRHFRSIAALRLKAFQPSR
jgi:predicted nucleic acid-binding protein